MFRLGSPVSPHVHLPHHPGGLAQVGVGSHAQGAGFHQRFCQEAPVGFRHLGKALPSYFTPPPRCVFGSAVVPGGHGEARPRCSGLGGVGSLTPSCPQRTLGLGCGLGVGWAAPMLALVAVAIVGFNRFRVAMELAPLWFLLATEVAHRDLDPTPSRPRKA